MATSLKSGLFTGYRLLPQRVQKTASEEFSAPQCEQYLTCLVTGEVGSSWLAGAFTEKNALAATIHAK